MQYAFGVQMYGDVLYLEFYSVFSESYTNHELLLCKRLQSYVILRKCNPAHVKRAVDCNSQIENRFS